MKIYDRPEHVFVAQFIGTPPMNVLRGRMAESAVEVEGHVVLVGVQDDLRAGEEVTVGVRAENIALSHERGDGALPAVVDLVEPLGSHLLLTLALGGQRLRVTTRPDFAVNPHDRVWLRLERSSVRLLGRPDRGELALPGHGEGDGAVIACQARFDP
jgi:multiple sugar transport system ATP-binding protein